MITTLLWDVDGTLLSFEQAEKNAIRICFQRFGLGECTDEMIARYSRINVGYWEKLERGEMTKPQILRERFVSFFSSEGIDFTRVDAFNDDYQLRLGDTICFNDDSFLLVKRLKGRVRQYAVTNGTRAAQEKKLRESGLGSLFDGVFISDDIGYEKPDKRFFDHIFRSVPSAAEETLIVGDSLTSDILGGNNAGIQCCWYNPGGAVNDRGVHADYEIRNLNDVEKILDGSIARH